MTPALEPATAGPRPGTGWRQTAELVLHLVGREFQLRYRRALFGWLWSVGQPLARFLVLYFVFTRILPVDVPDFPAFLFVGLVCWAWFSAGVLSSTGSALARRELLFRPGLSRFAPPLVSVLTDALNLVAALPVIAVVLLVGDGIPLTALALPVVVLLQLLLILGLGLALCTWNVYLRDVTLLVEVSLLLGFYVTPVFYDAEQVPDRFRWVLEVNPMARVLDVYRDLLVDGRLPGGVETAVLVLVCTGAFAVGAAVYHRASGSFTDEL